MSSNLSTDSLESVSNVWDKLLEESEDDSMEVLIQLYAFLPKYVKASSIPTFIA